MGSGGKSERSKKAGDGERHGRGPPKKTSTDRGLTTGRGRKGEKWYVEYISGYDLRWRRLRDWLEVRFQGEELRLEDQNGSDWFEVNLPRRLTQADRDNIDELREPVYEEPEDLYEPDPPLSD